jgi:hypothetical protein
MFAGRFGLVPQGGNQCALVTESYSPCSMEVSDSDPDEKICARVVRRGGADVAEKSLSDEQPRLIDVADTSRYPD